MDGLLVVDNSLTNIKTVLKPREYILGSNIFDLRAVMS